ncbi:putative methyltransferase (plasmid) [Cupriavidus necator H16]|uniref:Putative methyltransferase n=1 Tax=Cupriavidus necator (strain ATCC 17699 / DSM 428 / KCTC 22496 / NCIMB 10442 / H16 / Stanier 337) TaxID=381666 RepID=Q7WXK5_CUPNH|nr:putative methyltransferase [Cupriavidus necator H16]
MPACPRRASASTRSTLAPVRWRARHGEYGGNAFRSGPLDFRDRYFTAGPAGYALDPRVRAQVRLPIHTTVVTDSPSATASWPERP